MELPVLQKTMVEEFQCPGCSAGMNTSSGCFKPCDESLACSNHSAGTFMYGLQCVNIGLPKGFCRNGPVDKNLLQSIVRLFDKMPKYDKFNVPVWALEQNGYLFVRCYLPRINLTFSDVIHNAKISDLPEPFSKSVFNVADFFDDMD